MNRFIKIICLAGLISITAIANAESESIVDDSSSEPLIETPATDTAKPVPPPMQVRQKTIKAERASLEEQQRLKKMELEKEQRALKPPVTATNTPVKAKLIEMKRDTEQMKMEVKDRLATTANQIKDRLMTRTASSSMQRKGEALRNQMRSMLARFTAAIMRLDSLAEKIGNHIDRLSETGKDMAEAKAGLDTAKAKIAEATSSLLALKTALETSLDSDNPKEHSTQIRQLSEETKTKIKEAHEALIDVVNILKPGTRLQIEQANQSPTPSTTE